MTSNKSRAPKKLRQRLLIAGAVCFVIAVIAVLIGLVVGPGTEDTMQQAETPATPSPSQPAEEQKQEGLKKGSFEAPELILGADGMAEMEVTTEPRVAAAAAAQVLMSVDTTKVESVDQFRETVISRVMRPSANFVGAGDGLISQSVMGENRNGDDIINDSHLLPEKLNYSPTGWWWMTADRASFAGFASYGAKLESRAVEVYNQAEMAEYTEGASWTQPAASLRVDIDPEASFELYWVRVETTTTAADSSTSTRNPVALAIYCDPPSEGGVCAAAALMTKYPTGWRTNF